MAATIQFNTTGNPSLGGSHSKSEISSNALNNLFDDVSPEEAEAGSVEYRAIDITNVGDDTSAGTKFYLKQSPQGADGNPYSADSFEFGLGAISSTKSIGNETEAPASIDFAAYDSTDSALSLPDIPAGGYCRVWAKRIVSENAPNNRNISIVMAVQYA